MARKIKRFLVFMFFSLFFSMFSKKIQTTNSSSDAGVSAAGGQSAHSFIGVNSAMAQSCQPTSCECVNGEWYCNKTS